MKPVILSEILKSFPNNKTVWYNGSQLSNGIWIMPPDFVLYSIDEVDDKDFPYNSLLETYLNPETTKIRINPSGVALDNTSKEAFVDLWADKDHNLVCGANSDFCHLVVENFHPANVYYLSNHHTMVFDFSGGKLMPIFLLAYELKPTLDYLKLFFQEEKLRSLSI